MAQIPEDPIERLNYWRQKVLLNEEITDDELREAVSMMRTEQSGSVKQSKVEANMPKDLKDFF